MASKSESADLFLNAYTNLHVVITNKKELYFPGKIFNLSLIDVGKFNQIVVQSPYAITLVF